MEALSKKEDITSIEALIKDKTTTSVTATTARVQEVEASVISKNLKSLIDKAL